MRERRANESPLVPSASASGVESPLLSSTVSTDFGSLRLLSMSAYSLNEQFTVSEKVELLVNVLQSLVPDLPSYLLNFILVDLQVPPKWSDIALPKGRTLHACQIAFEEMKRQHVQQPVIARPYAASTPYVTIAPHPAGLQGRSASDQNPHLPPARPLQPRPVMRATESPHPPVTNGESPIFARNPVFEPAAEPLSRKRGRPSKAEVEERTRRLAEEGKEYQPKKRPKKMRPSLPADVQVPKDEESATPLLQTPTARAPEPPEDSSSGKRRPRRQPRDGSPTAPGVVGSDKGIAAEGEEPAANVAESPTDRLLASHRERGSVGSSLSRRTQQESDTFEHSQVDSDYPP